MLKQSISHTSQENPENIFQRFDKIIDSIYENYQINNLDRTLNQLKTIINNNGQFGNLINTIINNSQYNYIERNYANFNLLINKVVKEFTFNEQLYLITNIEQYGISYNEKTTELLKYFIRKILRDKLVMLK